MAQFDLALPKFGAGDLDDEKQRRKIMNYLVKLDEQLRFVLNNLDTENFTETFQQVIVSGGGGSGESSESLKALEEEINRLSTRVTQTASEIALKASAEELNELGDLMSSLNAEFKVLAGEISTKVSKDEYDALKGTVDSHSTSIKQTADEIELKADKTTVDTLSGKVSEHSAKFEVTAEQISSTVERVDTLDGVVQKQGTVITQTAEKIESKAEKTVLDALGQTVSRHESAISQTPEQIRMAVDAVQVGGTNLIRCAEGTIWVKTGGVNYNWQKSKSCQSGVAAMMLAWSGAHNEVDYESNIDLEPGTYTLSFWSWYASLNVSVKIRPNILGSGYDKYFDQYAFTPNPGVPKRYSFPLEVDYTGRAKFRFVTMTPWTTGEVYFTDVKLEKGNKATEWSPAPDDVEDEIAAVRSAVLEITPEYILQEVRSSKEYQQDIASVKITDEKIVSTVRSSKEYRDDLDDKANADDLKTLNEYVGTWIEQTDEDILLLASRTVGGTNLISVAEVASPNHRIWVQYGGINYQWEKSSFCQSGVGVIMQPFTGMNELRYKTDIDAVPGEYTLSFYCWRYGTDTVPTIRPNLFYPSPNADIYYDKYAFQPQPNAPLKYVIPLTVTYTGKLWLRFLSMTPWTTGEVYFTDVKLEKGNTATEWSPYPDDPSNGLDTGANSSVRVQITPETFNVDVPGTDGDFTLNRTGARIPIVNADIVSAQNLSYRYNGPGSLYVRADMSSGEIAGGNCFRSLTDALNTLSGKYLTYDVYIHVESDVYGDAELTAMSGRSISIHGGGYTLYGALKVHNTSVGLDFNGLTINRPASSGKPHALELSRCGYVSMYQCRFIAAGVDTAVNIGQGVRAFMQECELRGADKLIYLWYCCDLQALSLRGGDCSKYLVVNGATARMGGTRPDGTWEMWNISDVLPGDPNTLTIDYGTATPSAPVISTATYNYQYSDSYAGAWGRPGTDAAQGVIRTDSSGTTAAIYGTIWFNAAAIRSALSGKTIRQVSLRLTMLKGYGRETTVSVQLYGTNTAYSGRSGQPQLVTSYGTIGTTEPGAVSEITIPTAVISDIVSGKIQALVLKSDDSALYKDRDYSQNYARFAGGATADGNTCPRLTVVYQ